MRSDGNFADISGQCSTYRGLTGPALTLCQQLLSRVPMVEITDLKIIPSARRL